MYRGQSQASGRQLAGSGWSGRGCGVDELAGCIRSGREAPVAGHAGLAVRGLCLCQPDHTQQMPNHSRAGSGSSKLGAK